ncbi:MAG: hypothetical protein AABX38_07375 [Candidatus Micrarchaeota archaeon]
MAEDKTRGSPRLLLALLPEVQRISQPPHQSRVTLSRSQELLYRKVLPEDIMSKTNIVAAEQRAQTKHPRTTRYLIHKNTSSKVEFTVVLGGPSIDHVAPLWKRQNYIPLGPCVRFFPPRLAKKSFRISIPSGPVHIDSLCNGTLHLDCSGFLPGDAILFESKGVCEFDSLYGSSRHFFTSWNLIVGSK